MEEAATGIMAYLAEEVNIGNNTLESDQVGISVIYTDGYVFWNRIEDSQWGIALEEGCDGCVVAFNMVTAQSAVPGDEKTGVMVADDTESLVTMNIVSSYDRGISCLDNPLPWATTYTGCLGTIIRNNTVSLAADYGIMIEDSTNVKVFYNILRDNQNGVYIQDSDHTNFHHNHVRDSTNIGVWLGTTATLNTLAHCTITGTEESGIYVQGDQNTVEYNVASRNGYGIYVEGDENTIQRNTANNNDHIGIYAQSGSSNNYFIRNTARSNLETDCYDATSPPANHWIKNNCGSRFGLGTVLRPGLQGMPGIMKAMESRTSPHEI